MSRELSTQPERWSQTPKIDRPANSKGYRGCQYHQPGAGGVHDRFLPRVSGQVKSTAQEWPSESYICSKVSIPNTSSPCFSTRPVRSQSVRRLARCSASDFKDRAILVKPREVPGQLVQVVAEEIGPVLLAPPPPKPSRSSTSALPTPLFRRSKPQFCALVAGFCPRAAGLFALSKNAANARVSVLQVGSGVAVLRPGSCPKLNTYRFGDWGSRSAYLHRAQAHDTGDFRGEPVPAKSELFSENDFEGALLGLVQQFGEPGPSRRARI